MGTKSKALYELLDHCCSVCGGRLLMGATGSAPDGGRLVRCAECSAHASAAVNARQPYEVLCMCGMRLSGGQDAGLRCRRVEQPTPERPNEVVFAKAAPSTEPRQVAGPRPVRLAGTAD